MSWVTRKLGDVLKIQNGYAFDSKKFSIENGTPLIRIRDIKKGIGTETKYLGEYDSKYIVRKGDLLIGMDGEFGCYEWKGEDSLLNQRVCRLQNFENIVVPKFLLYGINSYLKAIEDVTSFITVKHLSSKQIANIDFPLPSLTTQQKIVEKLDSIFAEIDRATVATEANVKNAEALFQSYLTEVFERGGEDWKELSLQELLEKGWIISHLDGNHGGDYPKKEEFISSGVPYISANCLDGDVLDLSKSKFLSKERASKLRKGLAKTDDVLFAHNATVGPVCVLKTSEKLTILGTSLTYYRCNKEFIEPEYLANYMRSAKFKNQYLTIMRQSTRNQIPITKQREFFHLIPPLGEQKNLIKKFNGLLSLKNVYESKSKIKFNEFNLLKKSILKQAFNGELVKE